MFSSSFRFIRFNLICFGLLLIPTSLMFGRAWGDLAWTSPRLIGALLGLALFCIGMVYQPLTAKIVLPNFINSALIQLFLFAWGIVLGSSLLEIGTRLLLWAKPELAIHGSRHIVLSRGLPYRDAPYYTDAFAAESLLAPETYLVDDGHLPLMKDRQSAYINIVNGQRRTVDQPATALHTIYLFGGSTIFSIEVPDEYTVPSQLQKLVNRKLAGNYYRVENKGALGAMTEQQYLWLKRTSLRAGDIVIFYDGVNDIVNTLYYNRFDGLPVGANVSTTFTQRLRLNIYQQMGGRSEFVNTFLYPYDPAPLPAHFNDSARMEFLQTTLIKQYARFIVEAAQYATERQAVFYHFFQPNLFTLPQHSAYEKKLLNNKYIIFTGLDEAYRLGNPLLQSETQRLASAEIRTADLSNVLNIRLNNEEFYLDFCHVTEKANERIAQAIFDKIASQLLP